MNRNSGHGHIRLVDVAKASGYSVSTVSVVLNEAPLSRKIALSTRERVRATAQQLGYHPDCRARALRRRQSDTVAVVTIDSLSPVCVSIVGGIMEELQTEGYMPLLLNLESKPEQLTKGLNLLLEWHAGAIILLTDSPDRVQGVLAETEKAQIPVVAVGSDLTGRNTTSIVVDRVLSGIASIQHLSQLGHEYVAFILSEEPGSELRPEGTEFFRRAAAMSLRIGLDLVLRISSQQTPEVRCEAGRAFVKEMLEKRKHFTAIVSLDDWAAAGVASELSRRSLRVPEDCSIIVIAHLISSTSVRPDLSVMRPNYREMGKHAAQLAVSAANGRRQRQDESICLHRHAPDLNLLSMSSIATPRVRVGVR